MAYRAGPTLLLAAACVLGPPPAWAGGLLFSSSASGSLDILYLGRPDPVAGGPSMEHWASPAPDGCRFAYFSTRDGDREIYVGFLDDTPHLRLTSDAAEDLNPAWSPDGRHIAFFSTRDGGGLQNGRLMGRIYVMTPDGSQVSAVTDGLVEVTTVAWSADGSEILYAGEWDGGLEILARSPLGGNARALTRLAGTGLSPGHPAASPDGRRLAFSVQAEGLGELRLMGWPDGEIRDLGGSKGLRYAPEWAPDSRRIVYTFSPDGAGYDLREIDIESGQDRALVATGANERIGRWLPRDCIGDSSGDRE